MLDFTFLIFVGLVVSEGGMSEDFTVARIAGAAIFSLAIACWFSRQSELAGAVVKAMLFYNIVVASILAYGNLASDLNGIGLWPAIGAHLVLGIGCMVALRKKA